MADDWQPGDLALCLSRDGGGYYSAPYIEAGQILEVSEVEVIACALALGFEGRPIIRGAFGRCGYDARCFRKIRPHAPDAEDAETIRLLTGAPVREPAPCPS